MKEEEEEEEDVSSISRERNSRWQYPCTCARLWIGMDPGMEASEEGRRQALIVDSYDDDYDEVCGFAVNPMHQPGREK